MGSPPAQLTANVSLPGDARLIAAAGAWQPFAFAYCSALNMYFDSPRGPDDFPPSLRRPGVPVGVKKRRPRL